MGTELITKQLKTVLEQGAYLFPALSFSTHSTIPKNDIQDIRLQNGMYTLSFSNNETEINYDINLQYDMKLLVKWNSQEKLLSVKEEL